jgi:molybdenum cofactor guanylyltransferase
MEMKRAKITGIILAGGKGTRIGSNKSLLKMGDGYVIDRVLDTLSQFTSSIIIVTNEDQAEPAESPRPGVRVLKDAHPGKGPLGGIYTGLLHAETVYSLVVGCDMPFLNRDLLNHLVNTASGHDAVAPKIGWMIQPLHAVYSRDCLPPVEKLLGQGELQIIKLFELVNTRYVTESEIDRFDPDHRSFLNINTEDDLVKAQALQEIKGK